MGLHWLFGSFLRFPCFCLRRMSDFCPHLCHFQAICCLLDSICFHPFFLLKNTNMFSVALHAKLLYKLLSRPNSMTSFCFFTSAPCCFCSFPQKYGLISNFIKACPHSFSISRIFSLTQIRKREYPKILSQQRETRFELATLALARRCSTTEPLAHKFVLVKHLKTFPRWLPKSARRDSNSRPSPWQGDALPLSHSRTNLRLENAWKPFADGLQKARDEIRTRDPRLGKAMLYH